MDQEKAEAFNSFFASVFTREDLADFPELPFNYECNPLDTIKIEKPKITKLLLKLNISKAAGRIIYMQEF